MDTRDKGFHPGDFDSSPKVTPTVYDNEFNGKEYGSNKLKTSNAHANYLRSNTSGLYSISSLTPSLKLRKTSQNRYRALSIRSWNTSEILETTMEMKKEINLLYATSLMTGIIIGSGIFVSPVSITAHCGSIGLSLVVWLLSGLLTIAIALCYTELGGMMPHAGGEYAYFKQVIGALPAFLAAWTQLIVINPCFYAVLALTTTNYIFKPFFSTCDMPASATNIFSVWIIVTIVGLNCVYVRYVAKVQTVLAATKIIALLIIIVGGIVQIAKGNTENLRDPFEGSNWSAGSIAVAIYTGIFVYGGWQYLFIIIEEVKDPAKNVPRATVLSLTLVIVLYLCTNIAYFTVLTPDEMMASEAVAVSFADATLGRLTLLIPLFVASSTIGALNGSVLGGSRTYFAAARDGLMPYMLSLIHTHFLTPWPSVWLTCLISVLYCVVGNAVVLIEYLGFIAGLNFVVSISCLLYLRISQPNKARIIKIPLVVPIVCLVSMISMLLLGLVKQPYQNAIGLFFILSGIPVYLFCVSWENKPRVITEISYKITIFLQKLLLLMPPEKH